MNLESKLYASPVDPLLSPDTLNKRFAEFTKEYNKIIKNQLWGNYKKLKDEFKSYYKFTVPNDDDTIYEDYKNHVNIVNDMEDIKKEVLGHNKVYDSMETSRFKETLNQLIKLEEEYTSLKNKYRKLVNRSDFDDALKTLVPIKLKLLDINVMSADVKSNLKFKKGIDSNPIGINSKLKKYFPNTYFNTETNLEDLYDEYIVNEEYKKLLENEFFSDDSLKRYNSNKDEIKARLNYIKQSKSKVYYYLNLIRNNIEINETSLDIISVYSKPFLNLKNYCWELSKKISEANELFNNVNENYKIDDIDKIIENYQELNKKTILKEFVAIDTYENTFAEYKNDFILLNKFNSMSECYSSLINKYFQTVWKDKSTSLEELTNTFENHKEFTRLFNDGFFSQNIFKFLENSEDEIKSKIANLNSKCGELLEITNSFEGKSVFYESNLEEIYLEEFKNQNDEILKTMELLRRYNSIYVCYDGDKLISLDEKSDFDSLDLVDQLYKDLTKLYNDSEILK